MPDIQGIHHLKFPVADLGRSLDWYTRVLQAERLPKLDHKDEQGKLYGIILDVPGLGTKLELRLNAEDAAKQAKFDPVTLAVKDQAALHAWIAYLDEWQIDHSPLLVGEVGWLLVTEDPDMRRLRFYTAEQHGPDLKPSEDQRWLGE